MTMFHERRPDHIGVYLSDVDFYTDTPENFAVDFGLSPPELPTKFDERVYEPRVRHALLAHNDVIDGGPMPWPAGDAIIAKAPEAIKNKEERTRPSIVPMPPPPLSRRQFYQVAAMKHLITVDEALAAALHGEIPTIMEQFITDHVSDPGHQFAARMLLGGAAEFQRKHPMVEQIAQTLGMNEDQIDEMWRLGATL